MTKTLTSLLPLFCVSLLFAVAARSQETNALSLDEKKQGYTLLFDGKTVSPDIWQNEKSIEGYPVEDGAIVCRKGGNLLTKKEYGDFIFRFEFKLPPGGNNGVGIRAKSVDTDAAYHAMEIQILDNSADMYKSLQPYQYHGSIYGVVPAKRNAEKNDYLNPAGEWNYQEITARGSKIKIVLNGETIVDADIAEFKTKPTLDGIEHPGLHREKGYIGFLGHGNPVQFRNIRIKELDENVSESKLGVRSKSRPLSPLGGFFRRVLM